MESERVNIAAEVPQSLHNHIKFLVKTYRSPVTHFLANTLYCFSLN